MDRLTEFELLIKVAETRSLGAAADALGLSRAAASRHLAALERRVGARLVERNTRRLHFTEDGCEFVERAQAALADLAEAQAVLSSRAIQPTGTLRISASLSFAMQQIAPRLPRFHAKHPQLRLHIESSNRYLDMIEHGIDVAIRTREFEPDSTITIRRLGSTRRVMCASSRYLDQNGLPLHPQDLPRHQFLLYVLANRSHELHLTKGDLIEVIEVQGLLESNDGQVLRAAAIEGLGILVQPSYIVYDDIVSGRLTPILNDWDLPKLQINIAYPSKKHLSAKVRAFIDFMVAEFEANDYERKWTGFMGLQRQEVIRCA